MFVRVCVCVCVCVPSDCFDSNDCVLDIDFAQIVKVINFMVCVCS